MDIFQKLSYFLKEGIFLVFWIWSHPQRISQFTIPQLFNLMKKSRNCNLVHFLLRIGPNWKDLLRLPHLSLQNTKNKCEKIHKNISKYFIFIWKIWLFSNFTIFHLLMEKFVELTRKPAMFCHLVNDKWWTEKWIDFFRFYENLTFYPGAFLQSR